LAGVVLLALLSGTVYERYERARAQSLYPPVGRLVDIGGRRIQLDCRGTGSPAVVFESGRDLNGSLSWYRVQDEVAKLSRACTYSRAGILWSDPTPGPHTGQAAAFDLHAALEKSGEHPPFVLVGQSAGGINVIIYTRYFGSEVAGIVLVDSSHPEQFIRLKKEIGMDPPGLNEKVTKALLWTGFFRLVRRAPAPDAPRATRIINAYAPVSFGAAIDEMEADSETFAAAEDAKHIIGSRPLFVLTAGLPPPELPKNFEGVWRQMQDEEASWSSISEHQIVADSHHNIQLEQPERIVAAVRWAIDHVRVQQAHSTGRQAGS
jgi:pimeloyl-ACP methyl ester carboxylesterase